MSNAGTELPVAADEWLARYIVRKEHVRADGTVKPDPFIPYRWVELSVTRHLDWTEPQIWAAGELVAAQLDHPLQGRADAQASVYFRQRLRVEPAPEDRNPHHANVIDWPRDKQAQKEIALELVKEIRFHRSPARRA